MRVHIVRERHWKRLCVFHCTLRTLRRHTWRCLGHPGPPSSLSVPARFAGCEGTKQQQQRAFFYVSFFLVSRRVAAIIVDAALVFSIRVSYTGIMGNYCSDSWSPHQQRDRQSRFRSSYTRYCFPFFVFSVPATKFIINLCLAVLFTVSFCFRFERTMVIDRDSNKE